MDQVFCIIFCFILITCPCNGQQYFDCTPVDGSTCKCNSDQGTIDLTSLDSGDSNNPK